MQRPTFSDPLASRAIKAAALVVAIVLLAVQGLGQPAADAPQPVISTLEQLHRHVITNGRAIASFRVQGVVCAVPRTDGTLVLQDDSAALLLELPPLNRPVKVGDDLVLEGTNSTLTRGAFGIHVGTAPIVDVDGSHGVISRSGKAFLNTGLMPLRVEWFNDYGPSRLQVEYEGPGVRRSNIPVSVLFHRAGNEPLAGKPQIKPGLEYITYVGSGWKSLPDFRKATEAGRGTADGFDITRRARADQCALVFNGYLQVSKAGIYTFHVASDDGCRIFVGDPSSHCRVSTSPDAPRTVSVSDLSETISEGGNQRWSRLEGKIISVRTQPGLAELEIGFGQRLVTAVIINLDGFAVTPLPGATVRLTGIYQRTWMADESRPGRLLVPGPELLQILDTAIPAGGSGTLAYISQIRALPRDEARKRIPVRIRGIVTAVTHSSCMLQDTTGGIYLPYTWDGNWVNRPRPGEVWEFSGVTGAGDFSPIVLPSSGMYLGQAALPHGVRPTWSEFQDGSLDAEQVEIEAAVIEVSNRAITLLTREGTVTLRGNENHPLPRGPDQRTADSLLGSVVNLRGVYFAAWDSATRLVKPGLFQLGNASLSVIEAAPGDEFPGSVKPVRDLFLFKSPTATWGRVKVAGVVLHSEPREYILADSTNSIRVYTREPHPIKAGDSVEAVGFPQIGGPSPTLLETRIRKLGSAALPNPIVLDVSTLPDRSHDARLVQVEALLLNDTVQQTERVLELQAGQVHFLAKLASQAGPIATLRPGALVQLTGVYSSLGSRRAANSFGAFELLLNRPGDILVLRQGPWWTTQRILTLAAFLAIGLMLALAWAALLRRTVARHTLQLKQEIENRQLIEQHRLLEEDRARIARDIHDDLGAGLTRIGLESELARRESPERVATHLKQLAGMAYALTARIDEIVWAVDPQRDTLGGFADYAIAFAEEFLKAADIRCRIDLPATLPELHVNAETRYNLFLGLKEALNNVVRHAQATEVRLRLSVKGNDLSLVIEDNGRGFPLDEGKDYDSRLVSGHGVLNLEKRLLAIGGWCAVHSARGKGTRVEMSVRAGRPAEVRSEE